MKDGQTSLDGTAVALDGVGSGDQSDERRHEGWPWLSWMLLVPIKIYRRTAPMRAPRCRFYPSCSTYALEAVRVHGPVHGLILAIRRVGRCHPWNPGGVDHVPPRK